MIPACTAGASHGAESTSACQLVTTQTNVKAWADTLMRESAAHLSPGQDGVNIFLVQLALLLLNLLLCVLLRRACSGMIGMQVAMNRFTKLQ